MKNTPENKARFFAQYWGQRVEKWNNTLHLVNEGCMSEFDLRHNWLELKPLSQITDEDAIEVSKIHDAGQNLSSELHALRGRRILNQKPFSQYGTYLTDFLRSKGYALPFMGISVEQQIEWGWVKLVEQTNK